MISKVNIIGSGKVAGQLAQALSEKVDIVTVYSLNIENAKMLAHKINAKPINDLNDLEREVDLNIISVKDDVVEAVASQLPKTVPVVHTSGSIGIEALNNFSNFGILYPLQTFSEHRNVRFEEVPVLIEAGSVEFENTILEFCKVNLSEQVISADSSIRAKIHLSAVITNNFFTQLLSEAKSILDQQGLDYRILKPLLTETLSKSFDIGPKAAITGPAARKDLRVIKKQIDNIEDPKLKAVYKLISEMIMGEDIIF